MMISWGENAKESLGYSHCKFVTSLIWNFEAFLKGDLIVNKLTIKFVFIFTFLQTIYNEVIDKTRQIYMKRFLNIVDIAIR